MSSTSRIGSALLAVAALGLFAVSGLGAGAAPRASAWGDRDKVLLQSGRELEGRVVLEREDDVALLVGSRERWIQRSEIESIQSIARSRREILGRFRELERETPAALLELAQACQDARLVHERELFLWRVLLHEPQNDAANEALGHRSTPRGWRVRVGRSWRSLSDAERARAEWRDAWELRSEHWRLRCNAGLERTLDTLFELEYLYDAFYALFQSELELRELTEPIGAFVYAGRDQLPPISSHIGAWFDGSNNRLQTYFEGSRPFALFHEATHGVLHNVAQGAVASRGSLPPWLDEGWADYMEGVLEPLGGGRARISPQRRKPRLARVLDAEESAYGLHRILNFGTSDFAASSRQGQKYAQCYALFLYMLEGEDRRFREPFMDYLRDALAGKGQASTFRRLFRRDLDAIEAGHLEMR